MGTANRFNARCTKSWDIEAMTDPSYRGQILVLTFPLIGNFGVPAARRAVCLDPPFESSSIQIQAWWFKSWLIRVDGVLFHVLSVPPLQSLEGWKFRLDCPVGNDISTSPILDDIEISTSK